MKKKLKFKVFRLNHKVYNNFFRVTMRELGQVLNTPSRITENELVEERSAQLDYTENPPLLLIHICSLFICDSRYS